MPEMKFMEAITEAIRRYIGAFLVRWGLWYPLGEDLWDYMAVTGAVYFTGAFALLVARFQYSPKASGTKAPTSVTWYAEDTIS